MEDSTHIRYRRPTAERSIWYGTAHGFRQAWCLAFEALGWDGGDDTCGWAGCGHWYPEVRSFMGYK